MIWRIGSLLVISGTALVFLLAGAFIVIGFSSLFFGALVLAVAIEGTLTSPAVTGLEADPKAEKTARLVS